MRGSRRTAAQRIRQVLRNLVSNAVKYTLQGRIDVSIATVPSEARSSSAWLRIDVADTGLGIAAEDQPRVFPRVHPVGPGEVVEGAGVGLAISRRVANALGGRITVTSERGEGSTFSFWVPLRAPNANAGREPRAKTS